MKISVIIPTLNEETSVKKTLDAVSRLVNVDEIIAVDGGSSDKTIEIIQNYDGTKPLKFIKTQFQNRAKQMHEGTKYAAYEIFWFVHADTRPIQGSGRQIKFYMRYDEVVGGNFSTQFEGESRWARFLTWLYRNFYTATLLYGDSAIFVRRDIYKKIKGFKPLDIFENVDFYRRMEKQGRCVFIDMPVAVLPTRFENRSFLGTFIKWTFLQLLYWLGLPPSTLARFYKPAQMPKSDREPLDK